LGYLNDKNLLPDWIDFLESSVHRKWNLKSTIVKIDQACFEVYGPEHRDNVIIRIKQWVIKQWPTYGI